ncbi:MAG: ABC transporter permease [Gammaproteobacteria bacterium]|nr:ABC transporter permease [Gammaproteobacteria bacterium]MDH3465437.1 ABC transporter permease [Gammaproteobacteria bacterium]
MSNKKKAAIADITEGLFRWELWLLLAWGDIQRRYRRSLFGPLWTSLSVGVFVLALGPLYAQLMHVDLESYLPHLILGMLAWNLMANVMLEGCREFTGSGELIRSIRLPYSMFIYRLVARNGIVFLYQSLVFVGAAVVLGLAPNVKWLLVIPGFILFVLNMIWIGFICSLVATRYRDFIELLSAALRIMFFVTPIIWMPDVSPRFEVVAEWNPVFHFIEVLRGPFMLAQINVHAWIVMTVFTVAGLTIAMKLFVKYRSRVAFWL